MRSRLQRFMYGRYGQDDLNRFMIILALIFSVLSIFTRWVLLNSLGMILLLLTVFRMFSRNVSARAQENYEFLRSKGKVVQFFRNIKLRISQRNTHRFYRCPSCRQQLRVPKGKGTIAIRCPKCKTSFTKRT
jgi:LSD1 subclass zinc finger protein